jgi:septum formation protein
MRGLGIDFEVRSKDVDESFPASLKGSEIASYLSEKKANAFREDLSDQELLITADTIVWLGDRVFNKPESRTEAIDMVATLSGRMHEVYTGVCITTKTLQRTFFDMSQVHFGEMERDDIEWYIDQYRPFDKAGAYGIQEWIGYAGIDQIVGSFYNVMGLPTRKLYTELKDFLR